MRLAIRFSTGILRAAAAGTRSAAQTFDKRYLPAWLSAMISLAASTRFLSEGNASPHAWS